MSDTFSPYLATVWINGYGEATGMVDAEKVTRKGHTVVRFRPDGQRARWVAVEGVTKATHPQTFHEEIAAVIADLLNHEGAEGFSAGLRDRAEAVLGRLSAKHLDNL